MKDFYDPIIAEVRRNRAMLLEMYGGIDGLHNHMDEDRLRLEKEGVHFLTDEEMAELQHRHDKIKTESRINRRGDNPRLFLFKYLK
jgi:hypothetical protein